MEIRSEKSITKTEEKIGKLYENFWEMFEDEEYIKFAERSWYDIFQLHEVLSEYIAGSDVLDAGCGGGLNIYNILKEDPKSVTGIDLSGKALKHAKRIIEKAMPENLSKIKLVHDSILDLPFEDNSFNLVFSCGVLHHTSNPEKGFSELVRVLKPGGTIWVGCYGAGGLITGYLIPLARNFRNIIPYNVTKKILQFVNGRPLNVYRVLDSMYTEYRYAYRPQEMLEWYKKHNLVKPFRTTSYANTFYRYGRWIKGEGWVAFRAYKPLE